MIRRVWRIYKNFTLWICINALLYKILIGKIIALFYPSYENTRACRCTFLPST